MAKIPKVKRPEGGFTTPNEPLYLDNLVRTSEWELEYLELNMGITPEQAKAMSHDELWTWLIKLDWLMAQDTVGRSEYDICEDLYGLSYDQVISMPAEEFKKIVKPVKTAFYDRTHRGE